MLTLGIETSCDETGVALYDSDRGLLANAVHSQVAMHRAYGGVVPELASRDHIQRVLPLLDSVLNEAGKQKSDIDAVAATVGPGLAGALLVGAGVGHAIGFALGRPVVGVHHMEGHLLSPLLTAPAPGFPFIALLVTGGHTQLLRVDGVGAYALLGETVDDAAGEAFDKTAQLLGLDYPGGPAVSALAARGGPGRFAFPRPMKNSGDLAFSFSGLKTAVLVAVGRLGIPTEKERADIAWAFVDAAVDVLASKAMAAIDREGIRALVVAGGVGANLQLRERLQCDCGKRKAALHFPPVALCTDNGAMIALAGCLHLQRQPQRVDTGGAFIVRPRWSLSST